MKENMDNASVKGSGPVATSGTRAERLLLQTIWVGLLQGPRSLAAMQVTLYLST